MTRGKIKVSEDWHFRVKALQWLLISSKDLILNKMLLVTFHAQLIWAQGGQLIFSPAWPSSRDKLKMIFESPILGRGSNFLGRWLTIGTSGIEWSKWLGISRRLFQEDANHQEHH